MAPVIPTDLSRVSGYKEARAKLGLGRVRPWKWMAFKNPARADSADFWHWHRIADESQEYPFAKFNKVSTDISFHKLAC